MSEVPGVVGHSWPASVAVETVAQSPRERAAAVFRLLDAQARWSMTVLNLSPAEGLMSRTARKALDSDLASRLSEGLPWNKDVSMPSVMHRWSVELELQIAALSSELFGARYVDWRPVSTTMANAVALSALTRPGDLVAVQSLKAGGNMSYQDGGVCGVLGLRTIDLPGRPDFDVDTPAASEVIRRHGPRVVIVGGSKVLFPYDLGALVQAARDVGAHVVFDAAHLGPFLAAGVFNQPFADGVAIVTLGTHKLMGGPVGGLVLTNDPAIARRVYAATEPRFLQTRDVNKYAATAIALAELAEYRVPFARAVQDNVAALSMALADGGLTLAGQARGWSRSHMLLADLGEPAGRVCAQLAWNGILLSNTASFGEDYTLGERSALRMSVAQLTRRGMGVDQMRDVASLMLRAINGADVRREVADLAAEYRTVCYSFDEGFTG